MSLLNIPAEIRLHIYSELLVRDSPIVFGVYYGSRDPNLVRVRKSGLFPALVRVSKMVNREAIPLIYANNCFRFPDAYTAFNPSTDLTSYGGDVSYIAPFLRQIGANAGLLRHISIDFPTSFASREPLVLHAHHLRVFQLIRETCTDLRTVEISSQPPDGIISLWDADLAQQMLKTLDDSGLGSMPSLEKIVLVSGEYDIDE